MKKVALIKKEGETFGCIELDGSKSLSNRALILQALASEPIQLTNLSTSKDTQTLQKLLNKKSKERVKVYDVGHAGTTFRFLTAYLAFRKGNKILTGSKRMKKRPIEPLVSALNQLGAEIKYHSKFGAAPLKINAPISIDDNSIAINGNISSQFLSALLLIAPTLSRGLELKIKSNLVSKPYLDMTLKMLNHFGVGSNHQDKIIFVSPQPIKGGSLQIESDWSAASYYYSILALSRKGQLTLKGLQKNSWQGDSVLSEWMKKFGIETKFIKDGIEITMTNKPLPKSIQLDFNDCPDLAQTIIVLCAGLGIEGEFKGLSTLRHKETDRIAALQKELAKVNVHFTKVKEDTFSLSGNAKFGKTPPTFKTYEDHRMAMAFAPLSLLHKIHIEAPNVVEKSYPNFWKDLKKIGFKVKEA